jgi:hypothetical protein
MIRDDTANAPVHERRGEKNNAWGDEIVFEALPPHIPEGLYDAIVLSSRKVLVFQKRWAVEFRFRIVEQGQYFGIELLGYANIGSDKKNSVKARPCSKLASWCRLIANRNNDRAYRISLKAFEQFYFKVSVSTVRQNSRQRELEGHDQYSVVADIKEVIGILKKK